MKVFRDGASEELIAVKVHQTSCRHYYLVVSAPQHGSGVFMVHGHICMDQMARILNDRDKAILSLLAPEVGDLCCEGSGHEFQSILPPVSIHFARDEQDFRERIARLSIDDLEYLVAHILDGTESMGCMPPEDVDSLVALIEERISPEIAKRVGNAYAAATCDLDF